MARLFAAGLTMRRHGLKIVLPGGSGQVGRILSRHFHSQGHQVIVFSRRSLPKGDSSVPWQVLHWNSSTPGPWTAALEGADVCINLAGRSVNCRYNKRNRRAIYDSRVRTTMLLNEVIASLKQPPRLWINASTATIYRHALDRDMDEATGELGGSEPDVPETWNFSIDVAKAWEQAFFGRDTARTRKVAIRSAMTFSADAGGVFDVILRLSRFGLGGKQGSGTQYVSWIHEEDFARAIQLIIERDDLSGCINVASPNPLPNRQFMRTLR